MRAALSSGPIDLALPELHPGQVQVLQRARRKNFGCMGRGWRKSSLEVDLAVTAAAAKAYVLWTSFTGKPIKTVQEDQWKTVFGPDRWSEWYNVSDGFLRVPGWGPVQFASMEEPSNVRSGSPDLIIYDEMGEAGEGDYDSVLAPMLDKVSGSCFWGFGTPNAAFPHNTFWDLTHKDIHHPNNEDLMCHVIPVYGAKLDETDAERIVRDPHPLELPHYGEETAEAGWRKMVLSWLQTRPSARKKWRIERLCHFVADQGSQIENVERACILPYTEIGPGELLLKGFLPSSQGWYQKGADIAVSGDYTVIAVVDRVMMQQVYFRRFRPSSDTTSGRWKQIYLALQRVDTLFGGKFYVDVTGLGNHVPETMASDYMVSCEGVNFGGSSAKKVAMMDNLSDLVEGQQLTLFHEDEILKELTILQRKKLANSTRIAAPSGEYDDIPVALGLSVLNVRPVSTNAISELLLEKFLGRPMEETSLTAW